MLITKISLHFTGQCGDVYRCADCELRHWLVKCSFVFSLCHSEYFNKMFLSSSFTVCEINIAKSLYLIMCLLSNVDLI